jgi:hypothetical protein
MVGSFHNGGGASPARLSPGAAAELQQPRRTLERLVAIQNDVSPSTRLATVRQLVAEQEPAGDGVGTEEPDRGWQ